MRSNKIKKQIRRKKNDELKRNGRTRKQIANIKAKKEK
jgi:hypothetical protein|tara:strand:- start:235 stop:348 length:114 start_codon:yes stop_codon:yes gene_type:complete